MKKAIDEVCRLHPACKGYSCKSVSWDDVARTVSGSGACFLFFSFFNFLLKFKCFGSISSE